MSVRGRTGRDSLRLGGGSAFFNDRLDAAAELVATGTLDVLMLETLAERTLALLQVARRNGQPGYFPRLPDRLETLLPLCASHGTAFVSNAGGAAPLETAAMIRALALRLGLKRTTIAAVTGDDVLELVRDTDPLVVETGEPASRLGSALICANAYLGSGAIADAYAAGADVIVTGRVTDSALALGPIMAALGWPRVDYDALAAGIVVGHLLECGGQATGGYFAEPGWKDVPGLDRLGFPIAEVFRDGAITITKPQGSGGRIDRHTITEQLLYEIHDPARYLTPDVTLDLTELEIEEKSPDEVRLTGARGYPPPDALKALLGLESGFLVEAEISYAGLNVRPRAELAIEILQKRIGRLPQAPEKIRYDLVGVNSLWFPDEKASPSEIRLRVAARVPSNALAEAIVTEVEALYVNGPAGGGGVRFAIRPTIRTLTAFVPREAVPASLTWFEV